MPAERFLDRLVRRDVVFVGRKWETYMLCVHGGGLVGTAIVLALAVENSLSPVIVLLLVVLVAALSFLLFRSTRIFGRSHALLNWAKKGVYHFQIAALVLTVGVLEFARQPLLPYLDVLVVGMAVYQAFGRIGCFMAGCCHGLPSSLGVRYGTQHARTGYPFFVHGARLFPIQLVEASWLGVVAAGAIVLVVQDRDPGEALGWYIVGYGTGRFVFEFFRGDTGRIIVKGLSEPQWTAPLLTAVVTALAMADLLPFHWWYPTSLALMLYIAATSTLVRQLPHQLSDAELIRRSEESILREANLIRGRSGVFAPRRRRSSA